MFTAEFVAYLRNKPAGVPYISELMRAVQRRRTEDNVIMNVLTIGMCCHNEGMLPETDAPFTQKGGVPYMPWDTTVTAYMAKESNVAFDNMNELLHRNLQALITKVGITPSC